MTTQDRTPISAEELNALQARLDKCNYAELMEVRAAVDSRAEKIKADFVAQAGVMGLACHDGNGKPRGRRSTKKQDA